MLIHFHNDCAEKIERGKGVLIALVTFLPDEDSLAFSFPYTMDQEEAIAILKKFNCFPAQETVQT